MRCVGVICEDFLGFSFFSYPFFAREHLYAHISTWLIYVYTVRPNRIKSANQELLYCIFSFLHFPFIARFLLTVHDVLCKTNRGRNNNNNNNQTQNFLEFKRSNLESFFILFFQFIVFCALHSEMDGFLTSSIFNSFVVSMHIYAIVCVCMWVLWWALCMLDISKHRRRKPKLYVGLCRAAKNSLFFYS